MGVISDFMTDNEVLAELGMRLRATRLEQNITAEDLAVKCGVSRKTIQEIEAGGSARTASLVRVMRGMGMLSALDSAVPDTLPPADALSTRGEVRQRASRLRG